METNVDKECSAMGALFQQIITDMKIGAPLWEDFLSKAAKLHTVLKSTLSVIAAYLDAFQKIADAATNAKGATKDIGTLLTRICLRHKAVEARLKTFTSALMECLVLPLQDKLEEWKKSVINLDKEHSKDSKKIKAEIKKRSAETQRWQKKARKIRSSNNSSSCGNSIAVQNDRLLSAANQEVLRAAEAAQADLGSRLALLQETEKQALCSALVEERSRFCLFVACLKPVMSEELAMMAELSHLEDMLTQLDKHTADPFSLPPATEQMIAELKGTTDASSWTIHTPPSSPSSLGSRKSSMCSLGSIHSSSSGSVTSHSQGQLHSPSHGMNHGYPIQHIRHRSLSQVAHAGGVGVRLSSVSSQDSGFTSQDTLVLRPTSSPPSAQLAQEVSNLSEHTSSGGSSSSSTPLSPYPPSGLPNAMATWPNLQETIQFDRAAANLVNERPHTISTAYEKGHQRPALSVYTFQPFEHTGQNDKGDRNATPTELSETETLRRCKDTKDEPCSSQESLIYASSKPPLPQRCSSLERPTVPSKPKEKESKKKSNHVKENSVHQPMVPDFHQPSPDMIVPQPVYMNASELRSQAAHSEFVDQESTSGIYSSISGLDTHTFEDGQACCCTACSREWRYQHSASSSRWALRRPASFSGYADPSTIQSMEWVHRENIRLSHMSSMKRTSVPSFATLHEVTTDENQPALNDVPVTDMNSSAIVSSVEDLDLANLPPPPDFLLESTPNEEESNQNLDHNPATGNIIPERSITVAEAVKTLNEIRHQPASPGVVRRAQSMRATSLVDSSMEPENTFGKVSHGSLHKSHGTTPKARRASDQERHSFGHHNVHTLHGRHHLQSLKHNLKIPHSHTKTLPKQLPSHRQTHVQDSGKSAADEIQLRSKHSSEEPRVVSGLLSQANFVNTLNAKLALQQQQQSDNPRESDVAIRIRQHVAQKCVADPSVCHESLMDQIRRGTSLRRARSTNDRSAPKI